MCHSTALYIGRHYCAGCVHSPALSLIFFFQAEDGIRDLVRSRGLGDVYKRQVVTKTSRGAYMAQGHDGKGNKMTTMLSEANALALSLIHI